MLNQLTLLHRFVIYRTTKKKEFWLVSKAEQQEVEVPVQSDVVPAPTLTRIQPESECDLTPKISSYWLLCITKEDGLYWL